MNRIAVLNKLAELDNALNDEKLGAGRGRGRLGGAPLAGNMYGYGLQAMPVQYGYGLQAMPAQFGYGGCDGMGGARRKNGTKIPTRLQVLRETMDREMKKFTEPQKVKVMKTVHHKPGTKAYKTNGQVSTVERLETDNDVLARHGSSVVHYKINLLDGWLNGGQITESEYTSLKNQILRGQNLYYSNNQVLSDLIPSGSGRR